MANGLQDFLGAPNPFGVQPNMEPAGPAMEPGPLAYDPMNTGQGSMGMGMGAGGPGATNFTSDTGFSNEDFKERLLNPEREMDKILTLEATANAGDPNKSPDEKKQGWREAILHMRMMDTYPIPTQQQIMADIKTDMLDMGIDLDAYSKINRSGDAYIAAGNTLTEATRAGYTPLQAISKALGAYGAADRAAQLPDPDQVNMAFQLYGMASDTRKAMLDTRATGLEEGTFVVGPKGDQSVMTLNSRNKAVLDKLLVPYRDAQESDIKGTPYAFLRNGKVVTENLDQYEYARRQSEGIDMLEATQDNLNNEMTWAGKDGAVESGSLRDFLLASGDLGEDIRMVEPSESMDVVISATGQRGVITKRKYLEELNKSDKNENYDMKYFPADKASAVPNIEFSSTPGGAVEFSSGPAQTNPTASLITGVVTDNNQVTKENKKQHENIETYVAAESAVFKQRAAGMEQFVSIGTKLLNGLENTGKGGTAQRIVGKVTGIGTAVQDTINFFSTKTANKPYVEKFQSAFDAGGDIYEDILDANGDVIGQSDVVMGTWNDFKLTDNAPLWEDLQKIGLTDLQEMNTLSFNLAIASLRSKGIEDRGITNQKIALEMQSLGFGGTTRTNQEAVTGLRTFLGLSLDDYDRYNRDFYDATPMTITDSTYVPGKGNIRGGSVSTNRSVNPWVQRGFARELDDGTFESLGTLKPFDTGPIREQLGITPAIPGETEKVTVRVGDDPSLVNAHFSKPQYQTTFIRAPLMKPTVETTVLNQPLTIPLDLQNWGDMAISYTNQINAASERAKNDGLQPGTQAYANRMGKAENSFYTQYAVGYFGEAAAIDAPSPEREAFSQWIKYVRTFK
jgi:hypothetical protein